MQYFLPEYIKLQSELVQKSTFFWLVYLETSRHATQMNWINTKVKCIVHMGLRKVKKILRKSVVSQWPIRMLYSGKQKRFIIFIFCITEFKHMFVHSAQTHGAMLELKNRKKKSRIFWILIKNGQNSSCKVGFDIPPLQALNLSPLAWEVDLLPTRAEVYNIY